MNTFADATFRCAVCGERSTLRVIASTSAFGSYDLDLRPPPLARDTLAHWLLECPACGYVHADLAESLPGAREVVRSPEFAALRASEGEPALVGRFKRYALLIALVDAVKAGWSLLHAAWVCDDLGLRELAVRCREECADYWAALDYGPDEDSARMRTVMVDVLRRAGHFDEANTLIALTLEAGGATPDMVQVLRFQQARVNALDDSSYRVEEVLAKGEI